MLNDGLHIDRIGDFRRQVVAGEVEGGGGVLRRVECVIVVCRIQLPAESHPPGGGERLHGDGGVALPENLRQRHCHHPAAADIHLRSQSRNNHFARFHNRLPDSLLRDDDINHNILHRPAAYTGKVEARRRIEVDDIVYAGVNHLAQCARLPVRPAAAHAGDMVDKHTRGVARGQQRANLIVGLAQHIIPRSRGRQPRRSCRS